MIYLIALNKGNVCHKQVEIFSFRAPWYATVSSIHVVETQIEGLGAPVCFICSFIMRSLPLLLLLLLRSSLGLCRPPYGLGSVLTLLPYCVGSLVSKFVSVYINEILVHR